MPTLVMSLRCSSPRHNTNTAQLLAQMLSDIKSFATLCQIWPALNLNS